MDVGKWLGVAIAVAGLATSLVFWQVLRRNERAHVNRLTELAARTVKADLAEDMDLRLNALVRLSKSWELEKLPSDAEWKQTAGLFLHDLTGCVSVLYVDTALRVQREVSLNNDESEVGTDLAGDPVLAKTLNEALNTRRPAFASVQDLANGAQLRQIAVPAYRGDRFRGFVVAKFDVQQSLDSMMENDTGLGFSVMISEAGRELYLEAGADRKLAAVWQQDVSLVLPGVDMKISAWPDAQLLPLLRTPLPQVALLLGLAVTVLLVSTFYMARSARKHAREIEVANEQLTREAAARKESEDRFGAVLEMSADAILSTDRAGQIIMFNRGAETVFGWKREEVLGKDLDLLIPERFVRQHQEYVADFDHSTEKTRRKMGRARTISGRRRDGTEFPLEASISNLEFHGEKIYTAILRDVTQRHVAEEALHKAHDELEQRVLERTAELQRLNLSLEAEIKERKHAEDALRQLSGRLLLTQDEERRRIARELHDSTSQYLAGLALSISAAQETEPTMSEDGRKMLSDAFSLVERCSSEIRTMSYLLHPPLLDDLGLASALRWYVEGFSTRSHVATQLEISPNLGRMPSDLERALFRIVQETLTNVRKHSGATRAEIKLLRRGKNVSLEVKDNGHGFKVDIASAALGVGIGGMRERVRQLGGRLQIQSSSAGTVVVAVMPVQFSMAAAADSGTQGIHRVS